MAGDHRLGASDCERLRDRRPHQPVNTASSAALAVVGAGVVAVALRTRSAPAWPAVAVGVGGITAGLGSVDYHGWHSPAAAWLHDVGLVASMLAIAATDARIARSRPPGFEVVVATAAGSVVVGTLLARRPGLGGGVATALAAALAALEVQARRRGLPDPVADRRSRRARRLAYASLAAGAVLHWSSRTGGPLCRPDSVWQGHAGWHLATAGALGAWAASTLPS